MKLNKKTILNPVLTHEGGIARRIPPIKELERTVMACMLWESNFYESGESLADRVKDLVARCDPVEVATMAMKARHDQHLRHVPLLLVRELARDPARCSNGLIADTLSTVIQRADELAEFLSIYWKDGKTPIAKQVKKGLAQAFKRFNEYQLAKYNRDNAIKLRDVLFLIHAKPKDDEQAALWKRLVDNTLAVPDTWEVALSSGADKKDSFERLLTEKKLGYLALLRNLRNMEQAGVDQELVRDALWEGAAKSKALPFRFVAAARAVPRWEGYLHDAMMLAIRNSGMKLSGRTVLLVDASGSMGAGLSEKSDLRRFDAAAALAVLIRAIGEEVRVFRFNNDVSEVPARQGMALIDALGIPRGGTMLGKAVAFVSATLPETDRLIVITDEQSADPVGNPKNLGYMINVGTNKNGVGYGAWTHIDGFSEAVVNFILAKEAADAQ